MARKKQVKRESHLKPKVKIVTSKTENQKNYIRGIVENNIIFCSGPAGSGKAQPLDSLVYTPNGPKKMGDIKVGDKVCTPSGGIANVVAIHPQGVKETYQINFKNGNSVKCCEDHLWKVDVNNGRNWNIDQILNLKTIKDTKLYYRSEEWKRYKYRIKVSDAIQFDRQDNQIDPYILGVLLGDGGLTQSVNFTCHQDDKEIADRIQRILDVDSNAFITKHKNKFSYGIITERGEPNPIRDFLAEMSLMGKKSEYKFIPDSYKYTSFNDRLQLIRGLMDTDGTIDKNGKIEFSSSSLKLAKDVKEVLESLGCIVAFNTKKTTHLDHYRLYIKDCHSIGLFNLQRKKDRQVDLKKGMDYHYIESITVSDKTECQCITIDSNDSLYLTDNCTPTHNSYIAAGMSCNHLYNGDIDRIIVTRPLVCTGKDIGALPGELQEKINPYLVPMRENLKHFLGPMHYNEFYQQGKISFEPLEMMRGMTFHDTYMILDEAQNCTHEQIKMFITRMGHNSKVLINGDVNQTDLTRGKSGLESCMKRLKNIEGIAICELTHADIQRNDLISKVLRALET